MKYKVGDKVRINSLDWYNKNKDEYGNIDISHDFTFYADRSKHCGKVFTIDVVFDNCYTVKEDNHEYYWSDEMIDGLVQDDNNHLTETVVDTVKESNDRYRIVIDPRFDIEVDEGEYYAVRRKKEYPKTFLSCCDVLGIEDTISRGVKGYKSNLLDTFQKLLICRDAYWKLYGEEMGLGKPWEPEDLRYVYSFFRWDGDITISNTCYGNNHIFEFPTEEMRDMFYENFKELIEICKELL